MSRLDFFRERVNVQTLIVLLALVGAPAFGIAIAAATRGQILWLAAVGGVGALLATIFAPVELMLVLAVLGAMFADSRIVDSSALYYVRFVPMGMLTVRTILDVALHRTQEVKSSPGLLWSGLALCVYAGWSSLYSADSSLTFQRTLSMVFVIVGFGLGLPNYLLTFGQLQRAFKLVVFLIAAFVLIGTVFGSGAGDVGVIVEESSLRFRGFFANENTQGLMAMLVFYPLVWWWQTDKNRLVRIVLAGLVLGWGVLILLSGSRASFVGVIAGAMILVVLYGRRAIRYAPYALAVLLLLGTLLVIEPEFRRVLDFTNPDNGPVAAGQTRNVDRPYLLQRALELGLQTPIFGVGFGGADQVFENDVPYLRSQGVYVEGSHNTYARMFVDLGVIGVVLGLAVFALVLAPVFTSSPELRQDVTLAFLTATVVSGMTNAFFEDWLYGFGNASTFPMWFFMALIPIRLAQLRNRNVG